MRKITREQRNILNAMANNRVGNDPLLRGYPAIELLNHQRRVLRELELDFLNAKLELDHSILDRPAPKPEREPFKSKKKRERERIQAEAAAELRRLRPNLEAMTPAERLSMLYRLENEIEIRRREQKLA